MYDVFLSYNSKNRSEAQALRLALESHGLSVYWDRAYLLAGRPWLPALEEALGSAKAFVVLIGPEGLGRWQQREVWVALERQTEEDGVLVIPALLARAQPLPRFMRLNTWVDFQKGPDDQEAIDFLVASLSGKLSIAERESHAEAVRALICPYRGLAAFREDDAEFFFGRETVVEQLKAALDKSCFVALVGPSGSGKSSVVHAGLIPCLRRLGSEAFLDFAFMKPTDQPLEALAACLFPMVEPSKTGLEKVRGFKGLANELGSNAVRLADLIQTGRERLGGAGRLLLVVDQWEELYTLCRDDRSRVGFVAQLHDALEKDLLAVVCTIREDFVPQARDAEYLGERFERSQVYLHRMQSEDLLRAIEEPARKVGLELQEGLAERILDDLGDEPGQLPLLEFVLTELWKRRQDGCLLHDCYEELGGGRKAIAAKAEEVFNLLGAEDQAEVRRLFLLLVRPGEGTQDTRRRASLAEVGEAGRRVLEPLVDARLLTTSLEPEEEVEGEISEVEPDAGTVEITHEALITHWDRLRKWLTEDRDFLLWRERLRLARSSWEREGNDEGFLLTQAPLVEAEKWSDSQRNDLNETELDFINRSLAQRQVGVEQEAWDELEAHKQELQRKKQQLWALGIVALLFLSFALFGFWRWRLSLSRALAAEAAELHEGPVDVALLLSVQSGNVRETLEAKGSLLSLLEQNHELRSFLPGHRGRVSRVAFSPGGRRFATAGAGEIFFWDAKTGQRLDPPFRGHEDSVLDLAFSPDGTVLASCDKDQIRLWRVGDHQPLLSPIDLDEQPVRNLGFSPDGTLLVASRGGSILSWDYPGLQPREPIEAHKFRIFRLAWRKDGLLAASSDDGTISLWKTAGSRMEKIRSLAGHEGQVLDIAFSPDGRMLASSGWDKTIRLWNPETGEKIGEPVSALPNAVLSLAFDAEGKILASAGLDKVIRLWDVADSHFEPGSQPSRTLFGHGKAVWTLAFGKDGYLVSGGDEASAILWDLRAPLRFAVPAPPEAAGVVNAMALTSDGALAALAGDDGKIRLWDTVSEKMREPVLADHRGPVYGVAFSKGKLFSGGTDGRLLIRDLDHLEGGEPQDLPGGSGGPAVSSLAVSLDGRTVAVGDEKGGVRLWAGEPLQWIGEMREKDRGAVLTLAFGPDGRRLAAGGAEGLIRVWNVATRQMVLKTPLKGHDTTVMALAFDPKGRILASGSADRTIQLWDTETWKPLPGSPLTGPEEFISGLAFSPDGELLAASVQDGTVFLWDVDHQIPLGSGLRGLGRALSLAFHPDGRLAVGTKTSAFLFDLRYEKWRTESCRIARRNLTRQEWKKYLPYELYRKTCPPDEMWTVQ